MSAAAEPSVVSVEVVSVGGGPADSHLFGVRDLVAMRRVGGPVVSPDAKHIAFTVKELDPAQEHRATTSVWLMSAVELDGGRQLTRAEFKSDSEPAWLDNHSLAFVSNRSGSSQVWTVNIHSGETAQLTFYPIDVSNIKYNAAQRMLAFSCMVYPDIVADDCMDQTAARDAALKDKKFMRFTKLFVRQWNEWRDDKRAHVFVQRLAHEAAAAAASAAAAAPAAASSAGSGSWKCDGAPQDVMPAFSTDCPIPPFTGAEGYDVSPTGDQLAFSARVPAPDSSIAWTTKSHIYLVDVAPRAPAVAAAADADGAASVNAAASSAGAFPGWTLSAPRSASPDEQGSNTSPVYSPCGQLLVWLSMARGGYESDRSRPMVLHRRSLAVHQPVGAHVDQSIDACVFAPALASAASGAAAPSTLYLTTARNARHMIFVMQLGKGGELLQEPLPLITEHHNSSVAVLGRDRLVFLRDSFFAPAELFVCKIDASQMRSVTHLNAAALRSLRFGDCTEAYFRGALGEPVHGWLFRPADFDPERRYPLAVIVHGGPQGAIDDHWHYRWNPQVYAARGFAVLCINFHGSTGFGQAFCDSIRNNWGTHPYEDIMKGIAHFCHNYPWIDSARVGALGASYGGWMMNWLNGHTDQFKCLVNHCGIFSQEAMHCGTEELFFTEWEMSGLSWEEGARETYARNSPAAHVGNWKTPTLVVHGGRDFRVPDVEGLKTFSALQRRGVPSELLYFPDECHWVLGAQNSIVWHDAVCEWLERWLRSD